MARRKVKRSVRAQWPILPFAVDVDDEVAVKDALAALGNDAAYLRCNIRYYREPDFIEGGGPAEFWDGGNQTFIRECWLRTQYELDPPNGDDTPPFVDRELVSWDHPWVQEHLKCIPVFKRVILME
ncbi:hypothetical protein PG994_012864 [Apiospora phragmitis]|uniref:Uncharacterized protein n=1 Tax=Apiospora phragmitis TaxID=2905665 RepID=A0ABR1T8N8_9PEZI